MRNADEAKLELQFDTSVKAIAAFPRKVQTPAPQPRSSVKG
jgi:hypothetical protein